MKLHDVAVTPDSLRLVGVGPLLESPTGLQPSKCKVEKRLVGTYGYELLIGISNIDLFLVYNMETKQIEK